MKDLETNGSPISPPAGGEQCRPMIPGGEHGEDTHKTCSLECQEQSIL